MKETNIGAYRAFYYKEDERKRIWAESKEELFTKAREDVPDAKENALLYVSKYDPVSASYEREGKYLLLSGKDVTQIKLDIAPMSEEKFREVREYIKDLGAKFDSKQKSWYVLRSDENKDVIEAYLKSQAEIASHRTFENEHSEAYIAISYLQEGSKAADVRYGEDIGAVLSELQEANKGRADNEKLSMTYVKQLNQETNQYDIFVGRFNTDTGRDITKIYLTLPKLYNNEFSETVKYLRANGAKFDGDEKKWYITADSDLNKFARYLSIGGKEQDTPKQETVWEQNAEETKTQEQRREISDTGQGKESSQNRKETARHDRGRDSILNRLHDKQESMSKEPYNAAKEAEKDSTKEARS